MDIHILIHVFLGKLCPVIAGNLLPQIVSEFKLACDVVWDTCLLPNSPPATLSARR